MKVGPQPITIEEYQRRNAAKKPPAEPKVPLMIKPKRRGGQVVRLRRERASLLREVTAKPPPAWEKATQIWKRIDELEFRMRQLVESRKVNIKN